MADIRPQAVAGTWYPAREGELAAAVDEYLASAVASVGTRCPRAIIAPHAGLMYSGPVAAYAYALLGGCPYTAVVLVGPSHFVGFRGVSIWPRGAWETPFGAMPIAESLAAAIASDPLVTEHPAAHGREHSLEMQMPFLGRLLRDTPIVPLVMGYQDRDTAVGLGDTLARVVAARPGENILLVASSDLSHYEDAATAADLDAVVIRHVAALDADGLMGALEDDPRHACGGGPIVAVLRASELLGCTRAEVLRYADSGDVSGDKSAVVGYMAAAIWS
jgi:AmmeMemoRadiSam system protein B